MSIPQPDLAAIAKAAAEQGLTAHLPTGEIAMPDLPEIDPQSDERWPDDMRVISNAPMLEISAQQPANSPLPDELDRLIDEHVERIRDNLRAKAREAIQREVARQSAIIEGQLLYGHSDVPETGVATEAARADSTHAVTLPIVWAEGAPGRDAFLLREDQLLDGRKRRTLFHPGDDERPRCVVREAIWLDGHPVLRCHHGVSWVDGANPHATGEPHEGFACAGCAAGECAAVREAGSGTEASPA